MRMILHTSVEGQRGSGGPRTPLDLPQACQVWEGGDTDKRFLPATALFVPVPRACGGCPAAAKSGPAFVFAVLSEAPPQTTQQTTRIVGQVIVGPLVQKRKLGKRPLLPPRHTLAMSPQKRLPNPRLDATGSTGSRPLDRSLASLPRNCPAVAPPQELLPRGDGKANRWFSWQKRAQPKPVKGTPILGCCWPPCNKLNFLGV